MATREWLGFFLEAGVPRTAASKYAKSFSENRISMEMLPDLNKDYLRDLGVEVLGDVISILKHSKRVQTDPPVDKVEEPKCPPPPPPPAPPRAVKVVAPVPSRTVVDKIPDPAKTTSSSSVSRRLGPPKPVYFEAIKQETVQKKGIGQANVFDRLGQASGGETVADPPGGGIRRSVADDGSVRVVMNRPVPERAETGRRKYVLVTRRADGTTKSRQVLEPGDPRIAQMGIATAKKVPASSSASSGTSLKRTISGRTVTTTAVKRDRISADYDGERRNSTREPRHQSSVGSRFGDGRNVVDRGRLSSKRHEPDRPIGSQQPVARKTFHKNAVSSGGDRRVADRLGYKPRRIVYD